MTFILFYSRGLKSALIFDGIEEALKNDGASLVKKVKGIFGFKVKDTNGKEHLWIVDAKNGDGKVEFNGKGTLKSSYTGLIYSEKASIYLEKMCSYSV